MISTATNLLVNGMLIAAKGRGVIPNHQHMFDYERAGFDVEVTDVRKASREELAHGHVHGVGGHQH